LIGSNVIKILYYVKNILQIVKIKILFGLFDEILKQIQGDIAWVNCIFWDKKKHYKETL